MVGISESLVGGAQARVVWAVVEVTPDIGAVDCVVEGVEGEVADGG